MLATPITPCEEAAQIGGIFRKFGVQTANIGGGGGAPHGGYGPGTFLTDGTEDLPNAIVRRGGLILRKVRIGFGSQAVLFFGRTFLRRVT